MKTLYSIVFVILSITFVNANNQLNDSIIQNAQRLYKAQQYDSVIVLYKSLISQGLVSDKLYFNLANAYYKQREIAQAILWYERAYVLNPYNEDIKNNLAIVQALQPDKVEQIQQSMLQLWYPYVYRFCNSNTWAVLSLVFFIGFIVCVLWFLFTKQRVYKKVSFFIALGSLGFAIITYINASYRYNELVKNQYAIVMESSLRILTEPNENAKELVVVHGGLRVKIEKKNGDWVSIRLSDGKVGWVQHFAIEKI
ncbi:MAG TPA: SH3 domain-containing protein [Bacteroidales bacterium]|nr:SH3 domain-containing protein [Bacteroidales bacterium]HRS19173.1 SH3 domain-containing protein [Bacteroidales bacterium]